MTRNETAIRRLNKSQRSVGGVTVTYRRGNDSIDALVVVPGNVRHDEYGEQPATISARDRDFIVLAADLVIGGSVIQPKRGDEIDRIVNGAKKTFQVLPRVGERPWKYTDQTEQQIRIYTQEKTPNAE